MEMQVPFRRTVLDRRVGAAEFCTGASAKNIRTLGGTITLKILNLQWFCSNRCNSTAETEWSELRVTKSFGVFDLRLLQVGGTLEVLTDVWSPLLWEVAGGPRTKRKDESHLGGN